MEAKVRHIRVDTCSDRSTDLCRPNETHFEWASVDTYSDSSTDFCRPGEEQFDWTLSNWSICSMKKVRDAKEANVQDDWNVDDNCGYGIWNGKT
ncbi:hypothetical protein QJS10_CPA16g01059 [Acorus calamus]|uniref:Uncharacterized protein n=1 Tax=Acorus calamus TaxID=4465 RepID=A0AAV9D0H7_ACOCL|nr:hypothetical protein QJS10_CPA16g01059 [Acorus calamus]